LFDTTKTIGNIYATETKAAIYSNFGILKIEHCNAKASHCHPFPVAHNTHTGEETSLLLTDTGPLYTFTDKNAQSEISAVFSHHENQLLYAFMKLI
jgi:hypothetical protein